MPTERTTIQTIGDRVFNRSVLAWTLVLVAVIVGTWLLRVPMLRAIGQVLVNDDGAQQVDAVYCLGGSSLERGRHTAEVVAQGHAPMAWFTGGNVPSVLQALELELVEGEVSMLAARGAGLPEEKGDVIRVGTSTMEEAHAILAHAKQQRYTRIMVLSSRFHMRRVGRVFKPLFRDQGIEVVLHGSHALDFEEDRWWQSEEGLIMVFNEYAKLLYYWWVY